MSQEHQEPCNLLGHPALVLHKEGRIAGPRQAKHTYIGAGFVSRVSGLVLGWSNAAEVTRRMVHNRMAGVRAVHIGIQEPQFRS